MFLWRINLFDLSLIYIIKESHNHFFRHSVYPLKMGDGQPKKNTLAEGARIDSRKKVNQLLAEYHTTNSRKSSIVDSNIGQRKFRAKCRAE